ncbi:MAG TPA: thioesterase domain-containing protein [Gemmatimonadaceae bacterium]|nr:thioesterase domain-containing protein [Gemmatimonadaceae bacterium]
MIVPVFLEDLRSRNIQVWVEGDHLRCRAPTGVLTPALRDELRREKDAIVQFLRSADALARQERAIVPLQPGGQRVPVFAVPGHNGNVFSFRFLARELGEDQPFFGLQPPGVDGECEPLTRVEDLAVYFAARILAFRPGPYTIAGHCSGGTIAFELARELERQGATVTFLALFGSPYPAWFRRVPQLLGRLAHRAEWLRHHVRTLSSLSNQERRLYVTARIAERVRQREIIQETPADVTPDPVMMRRAQVAAATLTALRRYIPQHFAGGVALFYPNRTWARGRNSMQRWRAFAGDYDEHCGPDACEGDVMLHEPNVRVIAAQFRTCSRRIETNGRFVAVRKSPARWTEFKTASLSWIRWVRGLTG